VPAGYAIDRKIEICKIEGKSVGMDVIYPSGQCDFVPLMLQITSTKDPGKWINQRAYYIYGLLTTGYAGAIMDWNGGQRTAPRGEVFPEKRAARLLRARARDWNLSGRIGVTGHSKGSSRAGKAAFINEGDWEADRGPYTEKSDRFQVALLSAGQHAPEFLIEDGFHKPVSESHDELTRISSLTFLTPDDPPVFLSGGELDREFRVKQMKRLPARCEEVGVTYRLLIQKGMDHMYNPRPEVISHIYSFLDWYLKPESHAGNRLPTQAELDRLANEVLVAIPSIKKSTEITLPNDGEEGAIITALEKLGAKVEVDASSPDQSGIRVTLSSDSLTDADLELVSRLPQLQRLDILASNITDAGLVHIEGMTTLRMLSLKGSKVTDAGLKNLQGLVQLEMLSLEHTQIAGSGLEHLNGLPNLHYLNLRSTPVSDASLDSLTGLSKLQTLRLDGSGVSETGIRKIQKALPNCRITHSTTSR
jgi:hypothetical protein